MQFCVINWKIYLSCCVQNVQCNIFSIHVDVVSIGCFCEKNQQAITTQKFYKVYQFSWIFVQWLLQLLQTNVSFPDKLALVARLVRRTCIFLETEFWLLTISAFARKLLSSVWPVKESETNKTILIEKRKVVQSGWFIKWDYLAIKTSWLCI